MSFLLHANEVQAGRRLFLGRSGLVLSGSTIALLAGRDALAATTAEAPANDVGILNSALGAEQEAIAAYQLGADSGLLKPDVKQIALTFQSHHKAHADLLAGTVAKLGGKPVQAKPHYTFPEAKLKSQTDVLRFAAGLEHGAVKAYLGAIPRFSDRELSGAAGTILADEAMHWAVLRHALGEPPVPGPFVG